MPTFDDPTILVDDPSVKFDDIGATGPAIINPQLDIGQHSAVLTWTTDRPASSRVDLGWSTTYGMVVSRQALVTTHLITMTELVPAHVYHYRIESTDAAGHQTFSTDLTFRTAV